MMTRGPAANLAIFFNKVMTIGFGILWVFAGFKIAYDTVSSPEGPLANLLFLICVACIFQAGLGMLILTYIYFPKLFPEYEL